MQNFRRLPGLHQSVWITKRVLRPGSPVCGRPQLYMEVSMAMGVPPIGWFIRENPIKMDDDWGYPYFRKPPYMYLYTTYNWCIISVINITSGTSVCHLV